MDVAARRIMAYVLRVAALKVGHPVGVLVLMKANGFLFHNLGTRAADYLPGLSAAGSSNIDCCSGTSVVPSTSAG